MQAAVVRRLIDFAPAVVIGALAVLEVLVPFTSLMGNGSRPVSVGIALVGCTALAFRRTHPFAVAAIVLLGWPAAHVISTVHVMFWGQFVPIVLALYSVARHASRNRALLGAALGASCLLYFDFLVPELGDIEEIAFHWMVCTIAFLLGLFVRRYEKRAHDEARRAVEAEVAGREQALQAVADERARIARELHDIVAHSVSVMVVQAGAAQKALDDPAYVGKALDSIRTTGTSALSEMRRVVALIRDEDEKASLAPQPDLSDLRRLVATMDVPTTLSIEGEERELEAGIALSAYRIIQEALTNVRRHAQASKVAVTVSYGESALELEVADDGRGSADPSGGNGLIGMRERAAMYGGSVAAISTPGEGFRIRAVLPLATKVTT